MNDTWFRPTTMARMRKWAQLGTQVRLVLVTDKGVPLPEGEYRLMRQLEYRDDADWRAAQSFPRPMRLPGSFLFIGTYTDADGTPAHPLPRRARFEWEGRTYIVEDDPQPVPGLAFVRSKAWSSGDTED